MEKTIEDVILQHSGRGMELLRPSLPPDFCRRAARALLDRPKGVVLLTTGFYVGGHAETDGPAGTMVAARALRRLGYRPILVTDAYCKGFFDEDPLETVYMRPEDGDGYCRALLARFRPVALLSIERCGKNTAGDYANMRGVSIRPYTAPIDRLFELAQGSVLTIGVGDGGNEIGMGALAEEIGRKLPLVPCRVAADALIIATVSNWGAYGLAAALAEASGQDVLCAPEQVEAFLRRTVALGSVDGVSGRNIACVDGFPLETELSILAELRAYLK